MKRTLLSVGLVLGLLTAGAEAGKYQFRGISPTIGQTNRALQGGPSDRGQSGPIARGLNGPNNQGPSGPIDQGRGGPSQRGQGGPNQGLQNGPAYGGPICHPVPPPRRICEPIRRPEPICEPILYPEPIYRPEPVYEPICEPVRLPLPPPQPPICEKPRPKPAPICVRPICRPPQKCFTMKLMNQACAEIFISLNEREYQSVLDGDFVIEESRSPQPVLLEYDYGTGPVSYELDPAGSYAMEWLGEDLVLINLDQQAEGFASRE